MRRADALAVGTLAIAVCVYYVPQLATGTVQFDGVDVHYAAQRYASDEIRAGRLPFWTPYLFSGFPFLADLQVGAWYPLNWPFLLVGVTDKSLSLELLVHGLVACLGAYALARRLLGSRLAALGTAIFYALSGYFAAHAQHVGMSEAAAWLPWLVGYLHAIAERVTPPRLALGGLLGAALALPGHFQVALYAACGAGLWAILDAGSLARVRRRLLGIGSVGVWGALLAAIMLLPALELVGASVRTELDAASVSIGFFQPDALLTLVWPDFYGLLSGSYRGPGDVTQHYFYAGSLLLPLAVLGARDVRVLRLAALLGLPFLWYALGPIGGLYRVVSRLPGFASIELPMHGWFLPALGLALLGGAGLARLGRRWPWLTMAAVAFTLVDVLVFNQLLNPLAYARQSFDALYGAPLRAFAERVDLSSRRIARVYGPPLAAVGYRNHPLQSRVAATYGYNPLELRGYAAYAEAAERNQRLIAGFGATHRLAADGSLVPLADARVAWFAPQISPVADAESLRARLESLDPRRESLVTADVEVATAADPTATAEVLERAVTDVGVATATDPTASAEVLERADARLAIHYAARAPSLLRVAIPAFPGWRASRAGTPLTIVTVDGAFIGIVVPPGEGVIELAYTPRLFGIGAAISLLALLACAGALLVGNVRRPRWSSIAGLGAHRVPAGTMP